MEAAAYQCPDSHVSKGVSCAYRCLDKKGKKHNPEKICPAGIVGIINLVGKKECPLRN